MNTRVRIPACSPAPVPPHPEERRSKLNAILRGLLRRCPRCGVGPSLEHYLKVRESCPHCGEKLGHIRADDGPAYFTVLVVGHIVVPLSLLAEQMWHPPVIPHVLAAVALGSLLIWQLLPRFKGAMVGLMWALRLSGDEIQGDVDRHG